MTNSWLIRVAVLIITATLSADTLEPNAETLVNNGHWKRARPIAEGAFRVKSNDARAAYTLARVRRAFQNLEEAMRYAELAVHLDPMVDAYHRELGEVYQDQIGNVSIFKQISYSQKIRAEFAAAVSLAPNNPDNLYEQMNYFLIAPAIAGGDKKKALDLANQIVKLDPSRGYLALARIARHQKEEDKLESLLKKAVESNPQNYDARLALAAFYSEPLHQHLSLGEEHAKAAVELNPDRIGGYRWLAAALAAERRFGELAKVLTRAEAAIPDDLSPYVYAARAMLRDGIELPRAEMSLRKYFTATQEPEAGAPLLAGAHWSLGLVYEKEGRKQDARNELELALRLKPDFKPAKKDLQRLK